MAAMMTKELLLPDLAVSTLVSEEDTPELSSLCKLRNDKAMVIDFWTTKCTRCPAALEKLNSEAEMAENDDIVFVSCALSQGDGNYALAADLVCDGSFDAMTHCFMEMEVKETAKAAFGFTSVPFYVVVDKRGAVVGAGEPKSVNYRALIDAASSSVGTSSENENDAPQVPNSAAAMGLVFDEDF